MEQILHADCLEEMKKIPNNAIDLCLCDPPYGIGIAKKGTVGGSNLARVKDYSNCEWDSFIPTKEYFDEIFRISKNQIIFGGNYFIEHLTNSSCWIVWDKDNGDNNFADCELAWTSFKTAVRKYKYKWQGMLQEDMKAKEKRFHPTQKPVKLFGKIISDYSKETDTILDPFAGSGTTGIACRELKRNFILIEKEQKYIDIINQRLQQQTLF